MIFYRLDGAYSDVAEEATAFSGPRTPCYFGTFVALCPTHEMLDAERHWIRALTDELKPHALGTGAYVNVMRETDVADVRKVYGPKYRRLQAVKARIRSREHLPSKRQYPPGTRGGRS